MDKRALQWVIDRRAANVWQKLAHMHSELVHFNVPEVKLNARLWRTAGRCWQEENKIELGTKFFEHYESDMLDVILPHEIIHRADFLLYGESELRCGHGRTWRRLMVQYGLEPNPYHTMWVNR